MPSFTSNSSAASRLPALRFGRLFLGATVLLIVIIVAAESIVRHQGHRPSVVDSDRFWAIHRHKANSYTTKNAIVIVGASRAQLGIVPSVLEEHIPNSRVIQLTIDGTPAFEVFEDLCNDDGFKGIVLWSATAGLLAPAEDEGRRDVAWVSFYRNDFLKARSWDKNMNCRISSFVQDRLAIMSSELSLRNLLASHLSPKVRYTNLQGNRYRPARYYDVMTDGERANHRQRRVERRQSSSSYGVKSEQFVDLLTNTIAPLSERLRARGGQLVLLRMPTTDEHWELDERQAPKEHFWDRIEHLTAIPTVHFLDYLELSGFDCPDTSHLDARDAPEFTRRLATVLARKLRANNAMHTDGNSAALHSRR